MRGNLGSRGSEIRFVRAPARIKRRSTEVLMPHPLSEVPMPHPSSEVPMPHLYPFLAEGFIVVVPTYSLYPSALVPQMAAEVSDALSWCLDNAESLGGDPSTVALIGHSAGGHLAAMALLLRAASHTANGLKPPGSFHNNSGAGDGAGGARGSFEAEVKEEISSVGGTEWVKDAKGRAGLVETASYLHGAGTSTLDAASTMKRAMHVDVPTVDALRRPSDQELVVTDSRMPAVFVSMAGVYDIHKVRLSP